MDSEQAGLVPQPGTAETHAATTPSWPIPVSDGVGPRQTGFYIEDGELVFYD